MASIINSIKLSLYYVYSTLIVASFDGYNLCASTRIPMLKLISRSFYIYTVLIARVYIVNPVRIGYFMQR